MIGPDRPRGGTPAGARRPRWRGGRVRRGWLVGLLGIVLVGAVLGQRSADPLRADPAAEARAQASLDGAARQAAAALRSLADLLDRSLAEARQGAALTVAGDGDPGPHLSAAADLLADGDAERIAAAARAALARVAGELAILRPEDTAPRLAVDAGEIAGTGAQLSSTVEAADAFRAMRRASQATLAELASALAALDASDTTTALAALDRADAQLAAVRSWKGELATLPIWIDTTGALLGAARRIAEAAREGDAAALARARAAYQAATLEARHADLALAIAVAEGGAAVSATPLRALARAVSAVDDALAGLEAAVPGSTQTGR